MGAGAIDKFVLRFPNTRQTIEAELHNQSADGGANGDGEKLSSDQLNSRAEGTYGTVYETTVHLVRAEASYLHRLTGERRSPPFSWDDSPGLAAMRDYADQIGDALIEAAKQVQATDIVYQEWQGQTVGYKAIVLLIQAVNHGVEHRTNITTILSQLRLEAPGVDGWSYLWSNTDRLEVA